MTRDLLGFAVLTMKNHYVWMTLTFGHLRGFDGQNTSSRFLPPVLFFHHQYNGFQWQGTHQSVCSTHWLCEQTNGREENGLMCFGHDSDRQREREMEKEGERVSKRERGRRRERESRPSLPMKYPRLDSLLYLTGWLMALAVTCTSCVAGVG